MEAVDESVLIEELITNSDPEETDDVLFFEDKDTALPISDTADELLFSDETGAAPTDVSAEEINDFEDFTVFTADAVSETSETTDASETVDIVEEELTTENLEEAPEISEEHEEILEEVESESILDAADDTGKNSGIVIDGQSFVDALGGSEYASYTTQSENTYEVTLLNDIVLDHELSFQSGNLILAGNATISRADGYTGTLLRINSGASLTLGGNVILDGGAVWEKDGQTSTLVEGAQNTGITSSSSLIYNDGSFTLADNAIIQNNAGTSKQSGAIYSNSEVTIKGGAIRYCFSSNDGAVYYGYSRNCRFTMSGGEIYENRTNGIVTGNNYGALLFEYLSNMYFSGGTIRDNSATSIVKLGNSRPIITGGTYTGNRARVFSSYYAEVSGGTFEGNYGAISTSTNSEMYLSSNPEFRTETDTLQGMVVLTGAVTSETDIYVSPYSNSAGAVIVSGTNTYDISESDAEKFRLSGVDDGAVLSYNKVSNKIVLTYMTPILLEASVKDDGFVYDGGTIEPGVDFTVSVYLYENKEKGDDITDNYAIVGGRLSTWYRYRKEGSTGSYTDGLPTDAGKYTIVVEVSPDNLSNRASGQCSFTLEIAPKIVDFQVAQQSDVYYNGSEFTPVPDVYILSAGDVQMGKDYTLSYENNLTPGTCKVIASGIGNYEGSAGSTTFKIMELPVHVEASAETGIGYDGSEVKEGEDFHVQVYLYKYGTMGNLITQD